MHETSSSSLEGPGRVRTGPASGPERVSPIHFLRQLILNPRQIGAIAPSSPRLAAQMTRPDWLDGARTVVELGPGDGPVTSVIRERLNGSGSLFFAIEINEALCARLRQRFSDVPIHCDSAARVGHYLKQYGASHADCIISSIPWAAFDQKMQEELMASIIEGIRPGGRFITFTYLSSLALPSGRRFRRFLDRSFSSVSSSPIVWRNLPPALVYECVKA